MEKRKKVIQAGDVFIGEGMPKICLSVGEETRKKYWSRLRML